MTLSLSRSLLLCSILASVSSVAYADPWSFAASLSGTGGDYRDSLARDHMWEAGVRFSGTYLDVGDVAVADTHTYVAMKGGTHASSQDASLLSGDWHLQPAGMQGVLTLRLDAYHIHSNDTNQTIDRVTAFAPQLSYLSHDKDWYFDLGYAHSHYTSDLNVQEWTPTFGFAFNQQYDWMQFRGYRILNLNPTLSSGVSHTSALDAKWTHFFGAQSNHFMPTSFTLGALIGKRVYAVDMDSQTVFNLPDIQEGGLNVTLAWQLAKNTKFLLFVGNAQFKAISTTNTANYTNYYGLNVGYANISVTW